MLLTAGRLIKYDLKELFKKHIALYIVTLLAALGAGHYICCQNMFRIMALHQWHIRL